MTFVFCRVSNDANLDAAAAGDDLASATAGNSDILHDEYTRAVNAAQCTMDFRHADGRRRFDLWVAMMRGGLWSGIDFR